MCSDQRRPRATGRPTGTKTHDRQERFEDAARMLAQERVRPSGRTRAPKGNPRWLATELARTGGGDDPKKIDLATNDQECHTTRRRWHDPTLPTGQTHVNTVNSCFTNIADVVARARASDAGAAAARGRATRAIRPAGSTMAGADASAAGSNSCPQGWRYVPVGGTAGPPEPAGTRRHPAAPGGTRRTHQPDADRDVFPGTAGSVRTGTQKPARSRAAYATRHGRAAGTRHAGWAGNVDAPLIAVLRS